MELNGIQKSLVTNTLHKIILCSTEEFRLHFWVDYPFKLHSFVWYAYTMSLHINFLWMTGQRSHTASLLSASAMELESSSTLGISFTLSSTFSIQDIISSRPSCTLRERVRVTCSFSLRSLTDFDRLSYLSMMSSTDRNLLKFFFPKS